MNTFICFPLYVASRVFVQYLKSRPNDQTVRSTLHFLLSALNAIKHMNPLTESFLIQLKVDLGGTIMETPDIAVKTSCGMKGKVCITLLVEVSVIQTAHVLIPKTIVKRVRQCRRMLATRAI